MILRPKSVSWIHKLAVSEKRFDKLKIWFDLLKEFRLFHDLGDAATAHQFFLHHLLRLLRKQFVDGIHPFRNR